MLEIFLIRFTVAFLIKYADKLFKRLKTPLVRLIILPVFF